MILIMKMSFSNSRISRFNKAVDDQEIPLNCCFINCLCYRNLNLMVMFNVFLNQNSKCVFLEILQKQPLGVFCKIKCSWKFRKIHRKHLCQSLFFNEVAGLRPATLLRKRLWQRCFPVNFVNLRRTHFLIQNTSGGCFYFQLSIYIQK